MITKLHTICVFAACFNLYAAAAWSDVTTKTWEVAGLEQPATIVVDAWGVPHITAGTHYDAFFVQGFNAARDRLWQIDLWRRRGLGQLSSVLGADYVEQDKAARLFLYRGDMYREWLAYGSDAKRITEAFTSGINAYIDLIYANPEANPEANPALLPPEFDLLDYRPAKWTPSDVVRIRSNGLWRNVATEVARARTACRLGLEASTLVKVLEPAWQATVPDGLDVCAIPSDVLRLYLLAKAPVSFQGVDQALAEQRSKEAQTGIGSNNWVVAPERTDTSRPILADDPHRGHAVPSLRYMVHLTAPDLNVIGAGEPALPGISIGHNETIAFGLTIFPIDQEDLYVYAKAGDGYRYNNHTEPFRLVRETVAVRNGAKQSIDLKFTRHGPVIFETATQAFAVRAAWLGPGMSPYFGSVEYMRAQNWREFLSALNRWGAPSENQVYADIDGNIGYKPAGLFPKRDNWDGLLPVPGDGRYEWDGYFDMDTLPVEFNPSRGYTGTANSMNLPADYPIDKHRIGFEWSAPWRYQRLWEVLAEQPEHTMADSLALQRDYRSVLARRIVALLPKNSTGPASMALDLLTGWDAHLAADSAAAALYAVWYHRHLVPALIEFLAPDAGALIKNLDSLVVLEALAQPMSRDIVESTLVTAYAETQALLGDDAQQWTWGKLHRIEFAHPLLERATGKLREAMQYPSLPRGGSGNTTNSTGFRASDFKVRAGASFRMVLDVGNWDAALMTNAPAQSGDPRSPFYRNLLEGWATEQSFPFLYSKEAVERHAKLRFVLNPIK